LSNNSSSADRTITQEIVSSNTSESIQESESETDEVTSQFSNRTTNPQPRSNTTTPEPQGVADLIDTSNLKNIAPLEDQFDPKTFHQYSIFTDSESSNVTQIRSPQSEEDSYQSFQSIPSDIGQGGYKLPPSSNQAFNSTPIDTVGNIFTNPPLSSTPIVVTAISKGKQPVSSQNNMKPNQNIASSSSSKPINPSNLTATSTTSSVLNTSQPSNYGHYSGFGYTTGHHQQQQQQQSTFNSNNNSGNNTVNIPSNQLAALLQQMTTTLQGLTVANPVNVAAANRELNIIKSSNFHGRDDEDPFEWVTAFEQAATANQW
jgi:hypothetical protein